ncbi:MAG: hypothetical protein IPN95_19835 [Bacteroidetes bacterium]|nr:hypothetical protein [Bacteroidota bacterium]MBL0020754.1 hypothetical protein [Bacteroidota bacterium]MBP6639216.1 hypothetical protein [Bacteroidia bacterium]MBP6720842.1 hypothetical protein [Bacteroidia bacterium]MBP8073227.1 hypothetical protein [Bacteroidia bacterium]
MRGQELLTFSLNWSGDHVDEVFESPPLPKALLSENGGSERPVGHESATAIMTAE